MGIDTGKSRTSSILLEDNPTLGVIVSSICILAEASIISSTSGEASSSTYLEA